MNNMDILMMILFASDIWTKIGINLCTNMTLKTLKLAEENGTPPGQTAVELATEFSFEQHPIFGHRGQQIIDSLVKNEWHRKGE